MKLYHFTGAEMLRGIAKCGLTVGDVPTDLRTTAGKIGVWFSDIADANGHGLEESAVDKKRMRLTVDVPDTVSLVKWSDWAAMNVSSDTIRSLEAAGGHAASTWWIFFGWIKPGLISSVHDMRDGTEIENWQTAVPLEVSRPGVPYWRREVWQKKMLKDVRRVMERRSI